MTAAAIAAATIAVIAVLVGGAFGYILGCLHKKAVKANAGPPAPICMCNHNFGDHAKGGKCSADIRSKVFKDLVGNCPCQVYVGPDPVLSGYWTPAK